MISGIVGILAAAGLLVNVTPDPNPDPDPPADLGFWVDAGTQATTEITASVDTNVVSGVAPLAVFFDTKGTVSTASSRPYGELGVAVNFGDDQGENWSTGNMAHGGEAFSKNTERGPETLHVFKDPGTYEVTFQFRDINKKVQTKTVTIQVDDPEDPFAGANTILVSTGTDFTRGPGEVYAGALEVTVTTFAAISALCTAGKRVLLRRGDTWSGSGFLEVLNVGPFQLGAWGNPVSAKPRLTGGGNIAVGNDNRDAPLAGSVGGLRFTDLHLEGVGIDWTGATRNTLFMGLTMRDESIVCSGSVMNFFGHGIPDGVFFVDCDCRGVPVGSGNNIVFMAAQRQAYVGCHFEDSTQGEHCVRLSTAQRLVFAHCYVAGAPFGRHLLKRHAPPHATQPTEGAGSPTPGVPNPNFPVGRYSEYSNIHDNVFSNTAGCQWMVHPAPQNDAENERAQFDIIERNLFLDLDGDAAVMLFICDVRNSWIRANAFNRGAGTAMCIAVGQRDESLPELMGLHDCWIVNNTYYGPSDTQSIVDFRGPFGAGEDGSWSNVNEKNGLVVRGTVPVEEEFTSANDVVTETPGIATEPPVTGADFELQAGSPAIGAGDGAGAPFWDWKLRPINSGVGNTVDVGCARYEAA